MAALDLAMDGPALTAALVDVRSVSGSEGELADAVHEALLPVRHLRLDRDGDCVVARTQLGRRERVVVAGHLDTVPEAGNLPGRRSGGRVHGLGACDMKGGLAVALRLAAHVNEPTRDVTYVFYDGEEVAEQHNGLRRLAQHHREWLDCGLAVLMEPSGATVEAGCQGTLRAEVTTYGRRAHTARWWTGANAVHAAGEVLDRLRAYRPRVVTVDGMDYREGLSAVAIRGGVAGNVVPDECTVTVNYRFSPDCSLDEATAHVVQVFEGFEVRPVDGAAGALPRLDLPAAAEFVTAVGRPPRPKYGWTDVARFAAMGVAAVNYGPGDPEHAHTPGESVADAEVVECEERLRGWLG